MKGGKIMLKAYLKSVESKKEKENNNKKKDYLG